MNRPVKAPGLPPGAVIYTGEHDEHSITVKLYEYDKTQLTQSDGVAIEACQAAKDSPLVSWIDVNGIYDTDLLHRLGEMFQIHPLILEDIANTDHRPKLEEEPHYVFLSFKAVHFDEDEEVLETEHIGLIVGERFAISFQERPDDAFAPVRTRLQNQGGRLRKSGADYLAYALLDMVVDRYATVIEEVGELIEDVEEDLISGERTPALERINELKRLTTALRRVIWPLRDAVFELMKTDNKLIRVKTRQYLRDVSDHLVQAVEQLEGFREQLANLTDLHLSRLGHQTNEVMKFLTIVGSVFIPLTFIAGIYGMNFVHMPELNWRYGYLGALLLMLVVGIGMLIYFKKRKWF